MDSVSARDILRIHPDVVWRDVDGEIVLLNVITGQYFGLDGSGSRVWQILDRGAVSVGAVCETLSTEFDVDRATIESDVTTLVNELVAQQLVSIGA